MSRKKSTTLLLLLFLGSLIAPILSDDDDDDDNDDEDDKDDELEISNTIPSFVQRLDHPVLIEYYLLCIWNLMSCKYNGFLLKGLIFEQLVSNCRGCGDLQDEADQIVTYFENKSNYKKLVIDFMKNKVSP